MMELEGLGCVVLGEKPTIYKVMSCQQGAFRCVLLPTNMRLKNGKMASLPPERLDPRSILARPWSVIPAERCSFFEFDKIEKVMA